MEKMEKLSEKEIMKKIDSLTIDRYTYSKVATKHLDRKTKDKFSKGEFDLVDLYEIMLWKTDRFPSLDDDIIKKNTLDIFRNASKIKKIDNDTIEMIKKLLAIEGFELPMVSTILSFINPSVFQIIDKRTNRIILGASKEYRKNYSSKPWDYYCKYLEELRKYNVEFKTAGRFFYMVDIAAGHKVNDEITSEIKSRIKNIQKKFQK